MHPSTPEKCPKRDKVPTRKKIKSLFSISSEKLRTLVLVLCPSSHLVYHTKDNMSLPFRYPPHPMAPMTVGMTCPFLVHIWPAGWVAIPASGPFVARGPCSLQAQTYFTWNTSAHHCSFQPVLVTCVCLALQRSKKANQAVRAFFSGLVMELQANWVFSASWGGPNFLIQKLFQRSSWVETLSCCMPTQTSMSRNPATKEVDAEQNVGGKSHRKCVAWRGGLRQIHDSWAAWFWEIPTLL